VSVPNLLPAAERELLEAIDWYEGRRPGLGIDFLGVVDLALGAIADAPEQYAVWPPNPRYRRLVLDRFPYIVFYHVPEHGPEVVAIAHAKRRPGYWLRRVGP
jgi:plasmid stabilization system protein ParE